MRIGKFSPIRTSCLKLTHIVQNTINSNSVSAIFFMSLRFCVSPCQIRSGMTQLRERKLSRHKKLLNALRKNRRHGFKECFEFFSLRKFQPEIAQRFREKR